MRTDDALKYQKQESGLVNSRALFSHHPNGFSFNKHKSANTDKFNGMVQNDILSDSPRKQTLFQQGTDITERKIRMNDLVLRVQ